MIRINLLADKKGTQRSRIKSSTSFFITLGAIAAASLVVMGFITFLIKSNVSGLQAQSDANKAQLTQLSKKIEELKRYEKLNKELEQRSAVIETLRKNQSIPVRILDEVSGIIPEGVWLNSLVYRDNGVSLDGFAFTNIDIVSYVDNLKRLGSVSDVYLEESRETDVEKVKVYKFRLNFKVRA